MMRYAGWLIAVVLALVCIMLLVQRDAAEHQIRTLESQLAAVRATAATPPPAPANAAVETAPPAPVEAPKPEAAAPQGPDMGALLQGLMAGGDDAGDAQDEAPANPMAAMAKLFQGEQGKKFAAQSAGMAVRMQFGDLFRELNLDPEREEQLRAILQEQMQAAMESGFAAMEAGVDFTTMQVEQERLEAERNAQLDIVLTPEERAQFEAYEETLPQRMMAQNFDLQLNMYAGELDQDARALVRDVLVEESLPGVPETWQSDPMGTMQHQIGGFDRAEERLRELLVPEDFAIAQEFLATQRDMMESATALMGDFLPGAGGTAE